MSSPVGALATAGHRWPGPCSARRRAPPLRPRDDPAPRRARGRRPVRICLECFGILGCARFGLQRGITRPSATSSCGEASASRTRCTGPRTTSVPGPSRRCARTRTPPTGRGRPPAGAAWWFSPPRQDPARHRGHGPRPATGPGAGPDARAPGAMDPGGLLGLRWRGGVPGRRRAAGRAGHGGDLREWMAAHGPARQPVRAHHRRRGAPLRSRASRRGPGSLRRAGPPRAHRDAAIGRGCRADRIAHRPHLPSISVPCQRPLPAAWPTDQARKRVETCQAARERLLKGPGTSGRVRTAGTRRRPTSSPRLSPRPIPGQEKRGWHWRQPLVSTGRPGWD
jgi:hypothetical protein